MTPHVIGLDVALTATGIASNRGWVDVVETTGTRKDDYPTRDARIAHAKEQILNLVGRPDLVVIEGPSYQSKGPGTWDRAGLWWLLYTALGARGVPVAVASPASRMRYATGAGQASKGKVIDAVARRWPDFATEGDDNAADAVVLCAMGADQLGCPLAPVPKTHRLALAKGKGVEWPEAIRLAEVA